MEKKKILIIDDEKDVVDLLGYLFEKEGFEVKVFCDPIEALSEAIVFCPHLVLVDVMMPKMDGIEFCYKIKEQEDLSSTVVVFLSARDEDFTQIAAFDAGALDFIPKTTKAKVLVKKVLNLLDKVDLIDLGSKLEGNRIVLNEEKYLVSVNGMEVVLPNKEFSLLRLLYSNPDRIFTREEIYRAIWGDEVIVGDRTIDVHIRKIRKKIGTDCIVTTNGVGYQYVLTN